MPVRPSQVALDVDSQGLERGDVEDAHTAWGRSCSLRAHPVGARGLGRALCRIVAGPCALGGGGLDEPVDGRQEGRQRLARPGGRDDERVLAAADRGPGALLDRRRAIREGGGEPGSGRGGEALQRGPGRSCRLDRPRRPCRSSRLDRSRFPCRSSRPSRSHRFRRFSPADPGTSAGPADPAGSADSAGPIDPGAPASPAGSAGPTDSVRAGSAGSPLLAVRALMPSPAFLIVPSSCARLAHGSHPTSALHAACSPQPASASHSHRSRPPRRACTGGVRRVGIRQAELRHRGSGQGVGKVGFRGLVGSVV